MEPMRRLSMSPSQQIYIETSLIVEMQLSIIVKSQLSRIIYFVHNQVILSNVIKLIEIIICVLLCVGLLNPLVPGMSENSLMPINCEVDSTNKQIVS